MQIPSIYVPLPSLVLTLPSTSTLYHSLLLVCTHSNCVSSHLIILSSTLPSLFVSIAHARTHMFKKKATSPQLCWMRFDKICHFTSHVDQLMFDCVCFLGNCVCIPAPRLELFNCCMWYLTLEQGYLGVCQTCGQKADIRACKVNKYSKGSAFIFSICAVASFWRDVILQRAIHNVESSPVLNICRGRCAFH